MSTASTEKEIISAWAKRIRKMVRSENCVRTPAQVRKASRAGVLAIKANAARRAAERAAAAQK